MIRLYLDAPPSLNHLFPTTKGGGRVRSTAYRDWCNAQRMTVIAQRPTPIAGPVALTITLSDKLVRADPDNNLKAPIDLLVDYGLIEGDSKKLVRRITVEWGDPVWQGHQMGCLVEVTAWNNNAADRP